MQLSNILTHLTSLVGVDGIITQANRKQSFETGWRNRHQGNSLAVLLPHTIKQIQEIIAFCNKANLGIVPQGGNTSLCGGSIPINHEKPQIILSLTKLNKILTVDTVNSSITVQAGCTLAQVRQAAKLANLYFPLHIASEGSCQIGGNIATNAGGINVLKYGMMRDLVLGLEALLPNGEIVNQLSGLRKNNTNFDLKQLFIGSEGTLGIITQAVLKLFPQPINYVTALIGIKSFEQVIQLLYNLRSNFNVCAFEIIHQNVQEIYRQHFSKPALTIKEEWVVLLELETSLDFNLDQLIELLNHNAIALEQIVLASNETERGELWQIRENIPVAEKMAGFAIKHDISLPISSINKFIRQNAQHIKNKFPEANIIIFGHLGDGNLHYNIQFKDKTYQYLKAHEAEINALVYNDVCAFGGSYSAEHGIGQLKINWFKQYYDSTSYKVAHSIKKLLDPNNIFNPGKIFP